MIDDAFQAGTDAALQDLTQRPQPKPVDQRRFSAWRAMTALPRGVTAATAEALGSVTDVVKAFGTVGALTADSDPVMLMTANRKMLEDERVRAKAEIDSGNLLTSQGGDSLRAASEFWQPDPVTAHAAESLVFDFTRVGGKVIGGALTAGPIGVGFAAAEEGLTQADRLRQQGVDLATRTGVGAIQGAGVGIGAVLPVAGSTLGQTAALVAVGGPGTFIAQQAATRALLNNAGYGELASTYDPFDPVGLAVSTLIPAGFGAYGLRSAKIRAAAEVKAADAAKMAAPEPPSDLTPTAAAARGYVDQEMVDAAHVAYAVEQRRAGSLAEDGDIRGMARDDNAMNQALEQMARGERVEVSALAPETAPRRVIVKMNETVARLEEARAELVAQAEGLAERGEIREARADLNRLERERPDTSDAAIDEVARQIQERGDRKLFKTAQREAREFVADRVADWQGRVDRLNEIINRNAMAQRAVQDLPGLDRELDAARAAAPEPEVDVPAAAAQVVQKLSEGDVQAALRIAQDAVNRPPGELQPAQVSKATSEASASATGLSPEQGRIASLDASNPAALDAEVITGWDDKGQPTERMTARQYLEQVEKFAAEEVADSQLLQVAAECALRG